MPASFPVWVQRRRTVARDIAALIADYEPEAVDPETWESIRPFFREVMYAIAPPAPVDFRNAAPAIARFIAWGQCQLIPLNAEELFHVDVVERFISMEVHGRGRATVRSRLRS